MIDEWLRDLRYASRGLRRTPAFSSAAILTLAIGIGATTAVFSVVYGVLFRPLPFPNADRLVQIVQLLPARDGREPVRAGLSPEQVTEWRATSTSFAEIGYAAPTSLPLTGVTVPIRLNGSRIAVPLVRAVGVRALHGRIFEEADELAGNEFVVILAHDTWMRRFAGAPELVGRSIELGGRSYRVVGVMPEGFAFPAYASPAMSLNAEGVLSESPEFWVPMVRAPRPTGPAAGGMTLVTTFALLRPGVTPPQALAEANTLMPARVGQRYPIELVNMRVEQTRGVRRVLLIFQAAVIAVLFIACANITNLLLARAAARRRELAVKLALGASKARLARAALAESLIVSACGGALGWLLAFAAVALVRRLPPYALPRLSSVRMDGTVAAAACAAAIAVGVATGLWAAARALRDARREDAAVRGAGGAMGRRHRPSRALVVAETAAAVVLVAGAALLLTSFARLSHVERGFDAGAVFSFRVTQPPGLREPAAQHAFQARITASVRALPGVTSLATVQGPLGASAITFGDVTRDGASVRQTIAYQTIAPGLFETLRIPLRGRDFTLSDRLPAARTAIVNESFARRLFPGRDPVGQVFGFSSWPTLEIVGVAGDIRPRDLDRDVGPTVFLPEETTRGIGTPTFLVRTDRDVPLLPAVRAAVTGIDPAAVVFDATPFADFLDRQVTTPKFYGLTATGFAAVALLLGALGLYGVVAYSVSARVREFGIQVALGATARQVITPVLREAMTMVGIGVVAGLIASVYASRVLEALLFGVRPGDPLLLAGVAALFLAVAAVAAYVPARRATRVDPVAALRAE
jgi:predicted permease